MKIKSCLLFLCELLCSYVFIFTFASNFKRSLRVSCLPLSSFPGDKRVKTGHRTFIHRIIFLRHRHHRSG
ncbi:unnamed protein product [Lactuca virosa]|uniref:Secreted protein n=1 Tax=Lactuca virosa TaxID=75947 RepID=A0AAU9LVQ3_9ASTR|nr:unnamed protein product [Lactuca virosa]